MNLDETTDIILRRAREREAELRRLENQLHEHRENTTPSKRESSPKKSILSPVASPVRPLSTVNRGDEENVSPQKSTGDRRSRFAKLAAEFDEFECDLKPHNIKKESVVKGPQKRVSMGGETRASVLFTPGYVPQPAERRSITQQDKHTPEKKPCLSTTISAIPEDPRSPKPLGMSFYAHATSVTSLADSGPLESTSINFDSPSKIPGGIRNHPIKSVSASSLSITGIPKPYVSPILAPQTHSPVSFTPPKVDEIPFADESKFMQVEEKKIDFSYAPKKEFGFVAASYKNTPSPLAKIFAKSPAKFSSPAKESPKKRESYQTAVRSPIMDVKTPEKIKTKTWFDETAPYRDTTTSDDTKETDKEILDQTKPPVGHLRAILQKFEENAKTNVIPSPIMPLKNVTTQLPKINGMYGRLEKRKIEYRKYTSDVADLLLPTKTELGPPANISESLNLNASSMRALYTSSSVDELDEKVRTPHESKSVDETFIIEEEILETTNLNRSFDGPRIPSTSFKQFYSAPRSSKSVSESEITEPKGNVLRELVRRFEGKSEIKELKPKFPEKKIITHLTSYFGSASKSVASPLKLPVSTRTPENRRPSDSVSASTDAETSRMGTKSSVKTLRNRWEVSSATGTPMNPDSTSDEILDAAARMAIPKPAAKRNFCVNKLSFAEIIGKENAQDVKPKDSDLKSPIPKSPRYETELEVHKKEPMIVEEEMLEQETECGMETSTTLDECERPESAASATSENLMGHWLKKSAERSPRKSTSTFEPPKSPRECIEEVFEFILDQPDASGEVTYKKVLSPHKSSGTSKSFFCDEPDFVEMGRPSLLNDITEDLQRYQPTTPKSRLSSDLPKPGTPGSALTHTISFYRRQLSAQKDYGVENKSFGSMASSSVSRQNQSTLEHPDESLEDRLRQIEESTRVQNDQISQLTHALNFCRQNVMFHGGTEEIDAQRVLLIATERRRALIFERDRLCNLKKLPPIGPLGTVTIANISVQLDPNFLHTYTQQSEHAKPNMYHFVVLVKHREQVLSTQLVSSKHGLKNGFVEFPNYIQLHNLPPDFTCSIEVFALKSNSQSQYGPGSAKIKKTSTWKKMLASPYKAGSTFTPSHGQHGVVNSDFQKVGYFLMNRAHVLENAHTFRLTDVLRPLEGTIRMELKASAETFGHVSHHGFLSLYQTVDNMGSWTRFWCALFEGCMRFWRYPEDEETKKPLVTLRMDDFITTVKAVPPTVASFQFSMEGHIRIRKDRHSYEDIKLLLASDTKESMDEWLDAMNSSIVDATTWSAQDA